MKTNMEGVETLDKAITQYLRKLSVPQKEAVLTVVKTFAGEEAGWNNKAYIAEMDRRFAELESGDVKGYTLEEMEAGAREAYQRKKRNQQ